MTTRFHQPTAAAWRTYVRVAVVALIISIIPNFLTMANPAMSPFPAALPRPSWR